MSSAVSARDLTFGYPSGPPLFENLSMHVGSGTLLCLTGRSGAGKSTLLYCLAGVLLCDGEIRLMGNPLTISADQRAKVRLTHCGFIFQRGELLPELTVLENVGLPLRLAGASKKAAHAEAELALQRFGIIDCAGRSPDEISGGQAQRASVARALIHRPPIVFADEPTASLDAVSRDNVIDTLRDTVEGGAVVICATHDPTLIDLADDIFDMAEGSRAHYVNP